MRECAPRAPGRAGQLGNARSSLRPSSVSQMKDAQSVCCWIPTVVAPMFKCCDALHCCADKAQRQVSTPAPTPPARPACVDQHASCDSLRARLVAKGYDCAADLGKILGNASFNGRRL